MKLPNHCVKVLLEAVLILGEVRRITILDLYRNDFIAFYREDIWCYVCDWNHTIAFSF